MNKYDIKSITHLSEREVGEDIHLVKKLILDGNNKIIDDKIEIVKNFKRPFWVTKPIYRNHVDKKESEHISKLYKYEATESRLYEAIKRRLQDPKYLYVQDYRRLRSSPYLYGIEVDSRTILKYKLTKNENYKSVPYRIGVIDIETNVLTNEIVVVSIATYKRIITGVLKSLIKDIEKPITKIKDMFRKAIPEIPYKNDLKLDIKIFNNELELLLWVLKESNNLDIDILTGWNILYDITEIEDKLQEYGVTLADAFHYEKIPKKYKHFSYKVGRDKKVTESGREIPLSPEERWHTFKSSTNYYILDYMSTHRYIRTGSKTLPDYKLETILKHEGIESKLRFDTGDGLRNLEWFKYMIENKPIEFIIYNHWDVLSPLELDRKTRDLSIKLPTLAGVSHFDIFNSNPKMLVNEMFFFYLKHNRVLGVKDPFDTNDKKLGLKDWIVTLISFLIDKDGIDVLDEIPNLYNNIRGFVFDADVASAYPNGIYTANVSKDTTHRELLEIKGIGRELMMKENINLMFSPTNVVDYCINMFKLPSLYELSEKIDSSQLS